jgi:hypothetical protein
MRKKILVVLVFVMIGSAFWGMFIKSRDVTNGSMLVISLSKNQLKMETAESAKYISNVRCSVLKDTLKLGVKTTTVLNPFCNKGYYKVINLPSAVKLIEIDGVAEPVSKFKDHRVMF